MQLDQVKRRDFISLLGSAAAWPFAARAQPAASPRRIGFLLVGFSPDGKAAKSFRRGLTEAGYTEGLDVVIGWRVANGDYARVPELIADLIQRRVEEMVHEHSWYRSCQAFHIHYSHRNGSRPRPGRIRPSQKLGTSRRQRYRAFDAHRGPPSF